MMQKNTQEYWAMEYKIEQEPAMNVTTQTAAAETRRT